MSDNEILLGELKQFRDSTNGRLKKIEEKLDSLNNFKWKVTGMMGSIVLVFETYIRFSSKH